MIVFAFDPFKLVKITRNQDSETNYYQYFDNVRNRNDYSVRFLNKKLANTS